jgi:hypothetical protein
MKKKVNLQQIVAGALATTFLVESCTKYDLYYESGSVPDINQTYNSSLHSPFSVLSIPITVEEKNYLLFINYLLEEILINPQKAQEFMNAPNSYALAAGFKDIKLDLNDNLLQCIIAISDTEIRDAVINKDITKFIKLCKEKNIIKNFDIANSPIIKGILAKNLDIDQFLEGEKTSFVAFAVAVVVGVAVFIWAVAVTHVATTNVAVAVTAFETVAALSHVTIGVAHDNFYNYLQDKFFLQLWEINGGNSEQTYALLSEYAESQVNSTIKALKQTYPEKFENVNDEDLKQFLALNVQKLLE